MSKNQTKEEKPIWEVDFHKFLKKQKIKRNYVSNIRSIISEESEIPGKDLVKDIVEHYPSDTTKLDSLDSIADSLPINKNSDYDKRSALRILKKFLQNPEAECPQYEYEKLDIIIEALHKRLDGYKEIDLDKLYTLRSCNRNNQNSKTESNEQSQKDESVKGKAYLLNDILYNTIKEICPAIEEFMKGYNKNQGAGNQYLEWRMELNNTFNDRIDLYANDGRFLFVAELDSCRADQVAKKMVSRLGYITAEYEDQDIIYIVFTYPYTDTRAGGYKEVNKYMYYCNELINHINKNHKNANKGNIRLLWINIEWENYHKKKSNQIKRYIFEDRNRMKEMNIELKIKTDFKE